jgi:enoyl-CoA hydratase/carnithine racemase
MDFSVIDFEIIDAVAVIKMNNPPVNALGPDFLDDFDRVFSCLKEKKSARSLLLSSECPGFFSAGDDIESLRELDEDFISLLPKAHSMLDKLENLPIPTVAAINGHALGGGLELALVCDFRFMGRDCGRIGLPEVRLGMIPSLGGTQRLPAIVGKARAIEMMYKGLQITPEEAKQISLVNDIYPQEELYEKSLNYSIRLARQATGAIAKIKDCVNTGIYHGLKKGLAREQEAFRENIFAPDAREGVDAFLSGRKPRFTG